MAGLKGTKSSLLNAQLASFSGFLASFFHQCFATLRILLFRFGRYRSFYRSKEIVGIIDLYEKLVLVRGFIIAYNSLKRFMLEESNKHAR